MARRTACLLALWIICVLLPAISCMVNELISLFVNQALFVKEFTFWDWAVPVALLAAMGGGWTAVLLSRHHVAVRVLLLLATPLVIGVECLVISVFGFYLYGLPLD